MKTLVEYAKVVFYPFLGVVDSWGMGDKGRDELGKIMSVVATAATVIFSTISLYAGTQPQQFAAVMGVFWLIGLVYNRSGNKVIRFIFSTLVFWGIITMILALVIGTPWVPAC